MFKYKRMLQLIADDRERFVTPFFATYDNFEIVKKRVQIGDYIISENNKIIAAIERKSWVDLAASIKDGRAANINKMISLREQTGCKLLYLIEGHARNAPTRKFARIPYKNLQAHLDHLIMRDDVCVIYSTNPEDSAARLVEFMNNYITLAPKIAPILEPVGGATNEMDILSIVVPKTDLEIIYALWSSVTNITSKTASLFVDKYHISDLFLGKINAATIATMRYPNGTIIGKRAAKIVACADADNVSNHSVYCRLMAEIPGLTKKTAAIILTKIKFIDLLSGKMTVAEIADIKKSEKSRIGPAVAGRIYKFLVNVVKD
jgi:ERCC4-type nuclease